jgi:hypothetical protein
MRQDIYRRGTKSDSVEHRTSKDDLVPPWYKRTAYIMIIGLVAFILVYAVYILVFVPPAPATPDLGNSTGLIEPP